MTRKSPFFYPLQFYWRQDENNHADCGIYYQPREGMAYAVARCPRYSTKEEWEHRADFITRACNAHDDLVAACQNFISKVDTGKARSVESYNEMKAALAKAGVV